MPRKLVLDTTNTYLFLETVNLDSIVLLQLRLETVRFTWPYGVYIHVWGLEIYRIAASTKPSNPEKYDCGLGALLVAILHVIKSNLAKWCLQSSSRWTVPKNNNCLYKFVILLRHTFVKYRILDGRRSTDVNNVMHVKYSKVHDVHACLWKIICNKTFIFWPSMLAR